MAEVRKVIRFAKSVAASAADTMTRKLNEDATLERCVVKFYPGTELDLRVTPYIKTPEGGVIDIISRDTAAAGDAYLTGDDYVFDFKISLPIHKGWLLCVDYDNQDAANAYNLEVYFEVDELAGAGRVV